MRVLFASTHGVGHFNPLVPFIDACVRNGHEILVVGPPTLDPASYPFRAGDSPPEDVLRPLWERIPKLPPAQGEVVVVGTIFARLNVQAMLPTIEAVVEEWQPELVLRETNEYASAIAAERAGLPHARVAIGLGLAEAQALALATPALEETAPGIAQKVEASPYLTCFPESFDPPWFEPRRFRDPGLEPVPRTLPDWWPGDERPLVYMTFGSVAAAFPAAAAMYAQAAESLADVPARVLLTVGRELELGQVPPNVHVERWVPQAEALGNAAAVICHGGSGTTLGTLGAGIPLVVVPLFADQPLNAARVVAVGAGTVATLDGIRRATERVLEDESFRAAAGRIAAEMRELPPTDDFLD